MSNQSGNDAGKHSAERLRTSGRTPYNLSANEIPFAPLPGVLKVLQEAAGEVNRYPDAACAELRSELAGRLRVPKERVVVGTGSVALIQNLLMEYVDGPDDEVVFAWRSFEGYRTMARLAGAVPVAIPLREDRHDLDAMAGALTDNTRVVFVCNPNNPTGSVVGRAELEQFLDRVPKNVLVVIDEAYREFADGPQALDGVEIAGQRPNVVVFRTFSKAYGLAGLRIGFAVAHEPVAAALRARALPYGVSALAQRAAVESLRAQEPLAERVAELVLRRSLLVDGLRAAGWQVPDSHGNFVWLGLGERTRDFAHACEESGVMVKVFPDEGVRITVGEPQAVEAVLAVASRFYRADARHS
ncbi:histidinol-phosphate transaminase [Streptomyces sp. NPDC055897]